ncbi:PAS domain S-box protein [Niveibacterium sp. 24ML]|uniref:PAS domain-containing sensor histidine kinase n=1 Tax=Niveibacterium sp. 24ML TaxID=2985512 RepID=UPI002271D698|nr:PAS domain-containing protein [Niveibacterium sp. 24ML]MCX9158501.1 PAS domain S-box protein [Niveibacterium sp. 24ML]
MTDITALRNIAEARLRNGTDPVPAVTNGDVLHELRVHQIELEMQNESLRAAQQELEESRNHYADLYDFSPIGYLTLNRDGLISKINLTGANTLGQDRKDLLSKRFSRFVIPEEQDRWHRHFLNVIQGGTTQQIEVQLRRKDGTPFFASIDCLRIASAAESPPPRHGDERGMGFRATGLRSAVRIAFSDITDAIETRQFADSSVKAQQKLAIELTTIEERERRALAQDLHDNLSQLLAAIRIKLSWHPPCAIKVCPAGPLFSELESLVGQADLFVRTLTSDLSPPVLFVLGLSPALEWLAEEIEKKFGVEVRLHGHENVTLADETLRAIVFRSVREVLINVGKHSGAELANLSCRIGDNRLTIAVTDQGRGFATTPIEDLPSPARGFGLRNTRERLALVGGELEIDSAPGIGTTVKISAPLRCECKLQRRASDIV